MHANAANVVSFAVLATSLAPALAAPVYRTPEKRAVGAIVEGLPRGALSGVASSIFGDNDDNSKRATVEERAIGAIAEGLARGAVTSAVGSIFDSDNDNGDNSRRFAVEERIVSPGSLLDHAGPLPLGPEPVVLNAQERRAVGTNRPLTPLAPGPILSSKERRAGSSSSPNAYFSSMDTDRSDSPSMCARNSDFTRRNGESLQALNEHGFYGHGPVVLKSRAIGPILRVGAGLLEGVLGDDNSNDRRALQALNGGHEPGELDDRAIGAILRVGEDIVSSVLGGDSDNDRREVINIPKDLLVSLASGTSGTDQQQQQQQRRDGGQNLGGLVQGATRRSALEELD